MPDDVPDSISFGAPLTDKGLWVYESFEWPISGLKIITRNKNWETESRSRPQLALLRLSHGGRYPISQTPPFSLAIPKGCLLTTGPHTRVPRAGQFPLLESHCAHQHTQGPEFFPEETHWATFHLMFEYLTIDSLPQDTLLESRFWKRWQSKINHFFLLRNDH